MNDYALKLIRDYHAILLGFAKTMRGYQEVIREDDFMDTKWKCKVARGFVRVEEEAQGITKKIEEIRREYKCWDY